MRGHNERKAAQDNEAKDFDRSQTVGNEPTKLDWRAQVAAVDCGTTQFDGESRTGPRTPCRITHELSGGVAVRLDDVLGGNTTENDMGLFAALAEIERKGRQARALHSLVLDLAACPGRERDANELSKAAKRLDDEIATLSQSLPPNT